MALITCPKCGKQFSEHATACPQCGISQVEVQRLIEEEKVREAAEQERLCKEREAKEAEEARISAEQRAAWWKQHGKKVRNVSLISIVITFTIIFGIKATHAITAKHAIAEANAIVEQADALIATDQFDEARNICENGLNTIDNEEARLIVLAKLNGIKNTKSKEDTEYDDALKKLQILSVKSECDETRDFESEQQSLENESSSMKQARQTAQVGNNIYDLVVGSYTDDAKEPLREIRAKGYRDAFLVAIVDDNGCPRNRVIAKRVYSKEEARNVQKALTNQGIKSWIWRH